MSAYAVGDLQGCDREFVALLDALNFGATDELWLLGDLINRGPNSLDVLRRVKAMGEQCRIVLGNHDLHFLALYFGGHGGGRSDTFADLLAASDVDELAHWLRAQHLMYYDESLGCLMAHAGYPHIWDVQAALGYAREVERVLAGRDEGVSYQQFFTDMYGDQPSLWRDELEGMPRYRLITNYLTRMRLVDESGGLDFEFKGILADAPAGWRPWFEYFTIDSVRPIILFGHWAALDGVTGRNDIIGLDTGCVWGRCLTAMNLESGEKTVVQAIT